MTNEEKLSKALQDFKTKYPSVTSADLQTFIIGWQEAVKNCFIPDVSKSVMVSELRKGNLILGNYENEEDEKINSTICTFLGYDPFNNYFWVENKEGIEEFCNFQGVPATEERLKELGFELFYDGNYKRYQISELETIIYLRPSLDKWYFGFVNGEKECEINDCYEIEFIHEIQNLIFSLTKVSLTDR